MATRKLLNQLMTTLFRICFLSLVILDLIFISINLFFVAEVQESISGKSLDESLAFASCI